MSLKNDDEYEAVASTRLTKMDEYSNNAACIVYR